MRRLALLALPLGLAACGGGAGPGATTTTATRTTAVPARAAVTLDPPRSVGVSGRRSAATLTGQAAPGTQLAVRASCGGCQGLAFADARGRWHASLPLAVPAGARRLRIVVAYADARPAERAAAGTLRLRRATAHPEPAPAVPTAPATIDVRPDTRPRRVVVIGDSLAEGMAAPLRADLPGRAVRVDARVGRPLAEGMAILAGTPVPARAVLAMSLFTNDDPSAVAALEAAVRTSVARAGQHGCAVWATVLRPPQNGVSYARANARLRALAREPRLLGRLLIVPWAEEAARHPGWVAPDGVHGTPAGYAARAALYASAVRSCVA